MDRKPADDENLYVFVSDGFPGAHALYDGYVSPVLHDACKALFRPASQKWTTDRPTYKATTSPPDASVLSATGTLRRSHPPPRLVPLLDDVVGSSWALAVVSALLQQAGSGRCSRWR